MKKFILIILILFSINSLSEEVEVVCELSGIREQGRSENDLTFKEDIKLFVYWRYDDLINEYKGLKVEGTRITGSLFYVPKSQGEHLKIESNLSGGFKFSIQYWQEQSPLMSNDFIIDHQEILELNRYLAKSYSRGKHWSVVTYDNGVKSDLYIRWSAEGDCQKAEAQL